MGLSSDLVSQFVKITNDDKKQKKETFTYGTIVKSNDQTYVKLDGSNTNTPVSTTADANDGERVMVMIKNHRATVVGNTSSPAARTGTVQKVRKDVDKNTKRISEFEIIVADKVNTKDLEAETARIDTLVADNITINETLTAQKATIDTLTADNVTINGKLSANEAEIGTLKSDYGEFKTLAINKLSANEADILKLNTDKLSVADANIKYANIDFTNIGKAAMQYFYAESGLIKDVVVGDQTITGELVGVTLRGDRIIGNTIVADKLVIKGDDGLYYKLNVTEGGIAPSDKVTEDDLKNGLHGNNIIANTITADKISVTDLVAFDATLGGFKITENSIYSGVKESVGNGTSGIYLGNDGQVAFGDGSNYLKYYKDQNGDFKLEIAAESILFGPGQKNIDTILSETVKSAVEEFYLSTSPTSLAGGSWSTSQPTWTQGRYIWRRSVVTYGDGAVQYTPSETGVCITGNTGAQGSQGQAGSAGRGISSIQEYYYRESQGLVPPTYDSVTWQTTPPTLTSLYRYLYNYELVTYTDGTTEKTDVRLIGVYGNTGATGSQGPKGDTGDTGATGTGVGSVTKEFYLSTSKTTQTGGSWVTTMPTWTSGKYLWTRDKIVYTNPASTKYTAPQCDSSWEAVNEVDVGGKNLLKDSEPAYTVWTSDYPGVSTQDPNICKITTLTTAKGNAYKFIQTKYTTPTSDIAADVGAYYSFSAEIYLTGSFTNFRVSLDIRSESDMSSQPFRANLYPPADAYGKWVRVGTTVKIASGTKNDYTASLFSFGWDGSTVGSTAQCRNVKLEKGNKPTDWSPAPEEVKESTEEAAKTATNYLKFDSSTGLVVGDLTGSTLGKHIAIDSDSVDIRNGTTVLAKYEAKKISLGLNSRESIIDLCDGAGQIEAVYSLMGSSGVPDYTLARIKLFSENSAGLESCGEITLDSNKNYGDPNVWSSTSFRLISYSPWIDPTMDVLTPPCEVYLSARCSDSFGHIYETIFQMDPVDGFIGLTCDYLDFMVNNTKIRGKRPNTDELIEAFQAQNESGNTVVGWGNYNAGKGNTNIYGNNVAIGVAAAGKTLFRPYYYGGDTILDICWRGAGYLTSTGQIVYFVIPLAKPVLGNPTVTIASAYGFKLRQSNLYTHGSTANKYAVPSKYAANVDESGNYVRVAATFTTNTNATNNSPIGIDWTGEIHFSYG